MDNVIAKKFTAMFNHRRLNRSRSSLFTASAASVISLIVFTIFIVSHVLVRDFTEVVTIEIKTVVPYLPLRSEREQSNYTFTVKKDNNLHVLDVFGGRDVSGKFQQRVTEFLREDCEVNFMMTWISPAVMFGKREVHASHHISIRNSVNDPRKIIHNTKPRDSQGNLYRNNVKEEMYASDFCCCQV